MQYQNQRDAAYACACSRREIADSHVGPTQALIYPGTCRQGLAPGKTARAWRLNTQGVQVGFEDRLQGAITQNLAQASGDFVVQRADGLFAYQLAAVVDDAALEITRVVRGADFLDCSLRQVFLQQLLGLAVPSYLHLPVVLNAQGEKLSKQTLAPALDLQQPQQTMLQALTYLQHTPPPALKRATIKELLEWSINNWNPAYLPRLRAIEQTDY